MTASAGDLIVEVVVIGLRVGASTIHRALAVLDDGERAAVGARNAAAGAAYAAAHAAARLVLGERLGIDAAAVVIDHEANGRPSVAGAAFSLSHSGERAAVATAAEGLALGVDVERVRERPHLDRLARRVFAETEYDDWRARPTRARRRALAQRWTELESVLKARGTGIAGGLETARELPEGWIRSGFDAGAGYVGTVAAAAPDAAVAVTSLRLASALIRRDGTAG